MKPFADTTPSHFEQARTPVSISAVITMVCLILMALLFLSAGGKVSLVIAGLIAVFTVLNVLFSKRENLAKHNTGLLVVTLIVGFVGTFLSAVSLTRPLTRTDSFFKAADVDFDRNKLAYSESGVAMFKIGLTTEEFEKLLDHYREEAGDHQQHEGVHIGKYDLVYFELEPGSIDRDKFFDSSVEVDGKPFTEHLQNLETTDSTMVNSYIKPAIEDLMEGFPEFDDDLGRCRVIIWHSPEVTREFYWFENQQEGYMNP